MIAFLVVLVIVVWLVRRIKRTPVSGTTQAPAQPAPSRRLDNQPSTTRPASTQAVAPPPPRPDRPARGHAWVPPGRGVTVAGTTLQGGLPAPPVPEWSQELPVELKVGLAQLAVDGQPVPADWALSWYGHHPGAHLRTPAVRCPNEFPGAVHQAVPREVRRRPRSCPTSAS
ncbi:TerB N-terminal domain-containing protein [Amycolatopsis sp. NPDC058278]|uniref:TerB N-terminal domain-containing protein n=1 Tax=Amycolatopsis sp. NPDC058278 TaxID=3346417 RepID=UPI0036DA0804